jgi:hypothetical protein
VTWGLASDQHAHGPGASIHCLMLLARRDFQPFTGLKDEVMMLDFEDQFSFEDEEKLARVDVKMSGLAGAGRHEFFDDAELRRFDEMPTVTVGPLRPSPLVML